MSTKNIFALFAFWVFTTTNAVGGVRDGAWWSQLDVEQKVFYIAGLTDGVMVGLSTITMHCYAEDSSLKPDTSKCIAEYGAAFAPGFNKLGYTRREPANIVAGIDALYSDYRNINIPVPNALTQILRGMNGEANLEGTLEKLRKLN